MDEITKKFSADTLKDLEAALSNLATKEIIEKTKADDSGVVVRFVISTDAEDRQGDSLDQSKWDFSKFLQNPVVLWAHDYGSVPIGTCIKIETQGNKTFADIKFTPDDLNPFGAMIGRLAAAGYVNTVSVGYIDRQDGKRELLEISGCPVPANGEALAQRAVTELRLDMQQLVTKGLKFSIKEETTPEVKAEQVGDQCEMSDGTPGVLADDEDNPGALVCVPKSDGKALNKNQNEMENELTKSLQAEHGRHGQSIAEQIDAFAEKAMSGNEEGKALAEFGEKMDQEQEAHLAQCMKAMTDHAYDIDPEAKKGMKGVDEFKTAMEAEHAKHAKACTRAIADFKKTWAAGDKDKALADFTKAHGDELDRHEKAHIELCQAEMPEAPAEAVVEEKGAVAEEMAEDEERQQKYKRLDRAYSVFYAFTSAYMDETTPVDDFEKLLDEAVALMKDAGVQAKTEMAKAIMKHYVEKSGRTLSAKTKEKLKAIAKTIQDGHDAHNQSHSDGTKQVIDSLNELIGKDEMDDEGAEGKEQEPPKPALAPKKRSGPSGSSASSESFEAYMTSRQILKAVASATENGLRTIKEIMREQFPYRR